jgi:Mn-dependent DtxR family transcriptional regulator
MKTASSRLRIPAWKLLSVFYTRHKKLTEFLVRLGVGEPTAQEDACRVKHDICQYNFALIFIYLLYRSCDGHICAA